MQFISLSIKHSQLLARIYRVRSDTAMVSGMIGRRDSADRTELLYSGSGVGFITTKEKGGISFIA